MLAITLVYGRHTLSTATCVPNISTTISNIYNTIKSGFDQAVGYVTGLASQAFTWGKDIIDGIVNGIKSAIGRVKDAVSNVASTIRSYLHFSVPDVGPLTDYESWMPDFMEGLAKGIEQSRHLVEKAVSSVANDMVISPKMAALQLAGGGSVAGNSVSSMDTAFGNMMAELKATVAKINAGGNITIPVYLGNTLLDEVIVDAQNRQNLRSGGR